MKHRSGFLQCHTHEVLEKGSVMAGNRAVFPGFLEGVISGMLKCHVSMGVELTWCMLGVELTGPDENHCSLKISDCYGHIIVSGRAGCEPNTQVCLDS